MLYRYRGRNEFDLIVGVESHQEEVLKIVDA